MPETPYQGVMKCEKIDEKTKEKFKEIEMMEIKKNLTELENKLFEMVRRKELKEKRKKLKICLEF